MGLLAPAKINLSLQIAGKRTDGYHELSGLVAFAAFGDYLSFHPSDGEGGVDLRLTGPFASDLSKSGSTIEDNLVLKAVHLYEHITGLSFSGQMVLEKKLPLAAGIGGGSADAAAALRLLHNLDRTSCGADGLQEMALQIGADVPMCLASKAQWVSGIGEVCRPVTGFPPLACLLVNPLKKLSTAGMFRRLAAPPLSPGHKAAMPDLSSFASQSALLDWLGTQRNDLQEAAIANEPEVARVLEAIEGDENCALARMSGSGATCFGLYYREREAEEAARKLEADHPDWWVVATVLR